MQHTKLTHLKDENAQSRSLIFTPGVRRMDLTQ
uniref:Uncharacterized protein n=1 Tax=Anguilla anguilla TaxID=7936 RepID=A0A0E9V3H5_ANGAN